MTREEFLKTWPELAKNYQPTPKTSARLKNVSLLMIIGGSGVGKTSIIKQLDIPYVPADITRPIRPEEIHGKDYYFRTDYGQLISDIKTQKFVQVAIGAAGDFYGTRPDAYPDFGAAVYSVVADVVPIFRKLGFKKTTSAFIVPPSYDEWMRRMGSHELKPDQLQKRLKEARRSFKFALNDPQMHFILNDTVADAVAQLKNLLKGKIDKSRDRTARNIAEQNYHKLLELLNK